MAPFYLLDLDTSGLFAEDAAPGARDQQYPLQAMIKLGIGWGPRRGFEAY